MAQIQSRPGRAADVAQLAAQLSTVPVPVQLINSMDDFAANQVPVCVLNVSVHIAFVAANYPNTAITVRLPWTQPQTLNPNYNHKP